MREDEILDATESVLLTAGTAGFRIEDIAETADVAVGTVYRYFGSKDGLVAAARERYMRRWADATQHITSATDQTCRHQLSSLIETVLRFGTANAELHHVLFHQAGVDEGDAFAELSAAVSAVIIRGVDAGEFHAADPRAAAAYVIHGLHGLLAGAAHHARLAEVTEAAKDLVAATLRADR